MHHYISRQNKYVTEQGKPTCRWHDDGRLAACWLPKECARHWNALDEMRAADTPGGDPLLLSCNGDPSNYVASAVRSLPTTDQPLRLHRVDYNFCLSTSGYILRRRYLPTLLALWRETLAERRRQGGTRSVANAIDVVWKTLQCRDRWFLSAPKLGFQRKSYSDLQFREVDYKV